MAVYDDPAELARLVAAAPRPILVGLDVDGVLAPLVDHAADAVLLSGMGDAVRAVAALESVDVVVVSGRSLDGLAQFGFGRDVDVIGSHGMEIRDRGMEPLDAEGIIAMLRTHAHVVVIEEAGPNGSLGSRIKGLAWDAGAACRPGTFSLRDEFIHVYGSHDQVLSAHGLGAGQIAAALKLT